MRAPTLRAFQWLHTWAGICAGFVLFISFLGGTLTMFHEEIGRWERPASRHLPVDGGPAQRLVGTLVALHPTSADIFGVVLASETHREPFVYWEEGGNWKYARLAQGGKSILDTSLGFDDFSEDSLGAAEQASAAEAAARAQASAERVPAAAMRSPEQAEASGTAGSQLSNAIRAARASSSADAGASSDLPVQRLAAGHQSGGTIITLVDHDTLDLSTAPGLAEFIDKLHYSLALSKPGLYLLGVVALMFGVALVSGMVIHWPRLARDLFAQRPGANIKLFWQRTHNAVGVLALPFHAIIALTGSVLCLGLVAVMLFNTIAFDGKLMREIVAMRSAAPSLPVTAVPGAPMSVDQLVARARSEVSTFTPRWIAYTRYGADDGFAEVWGDSERAPGSLGSVTLRLNDGALLARQTAAMRDAHHTVSSAVFGLHFGTYGGLAVRWIYFVLGIAGAALIFTGNLLWLEARRKLGSDKQSLATLNISRATVAICIGSCAAIAAGFDAALLLPSIETSSVYLTVLVLSIVLSFTGAPIATARDLLFATALFCLAIPFLDAALTPDNLFSLVMRGDWQLASIDLAGLVFAAIFAVASMLVNRRGHRGDPFSVWSMRS
ncbi:PepSY-associated TM helix domain-containing protein [Pararobbsia alpina]|uniref:PepSY domain-containing protein n=1 Tax=Pararobbsia alpina TaxID=621374 RepID=A0A6S7BN95_9BURK|nr:PepSY-associated TM helix domain-containing protein [Pararobbsia alpina]CAB3794229.1 hypothetical protein LMG28138_03650 [Pararobbsia alpina]